jgi:hypothetical protein
MPGPGIPANGFEERGGLNSVGGSDDYNLPGTVTSLAVRNVANLCDHVRAVAASAERRFDSSSAP